MTELPPHVQAIPGVDHTAIESIRQQIDLAQTVYDPNGVFCHQRAADCAFRVVRDTTSLDIPSIYRHPITQFGATSSKRHTTPESFVTTTITAGDHTDTYSSLDHDQQPMAAHLLQAIAGVSLEVFKQQPQSVLPALSKLSASQRSFFQRRVVQKTYDPAGTETDAVHLTLNEMSMPGGPIAPGYSVNLARPLTIDGLQYVYWQYITCDNPSLPAFYHHRAAFSHRRPFELGERYRTDAEATMLPQTGIAKPGQLSLSGLEAYLMQQSSQLVGALTRDDLDRILNEPLDASLRLG